MPRKRVKVKITKKKGPKGKAVVKKKKTMKKY